MDNKPIRDPYMHRFSKALHSFDEMEKPHAAAEAPVFYYKTIPLRPNDLSVGFICNCSKHILFANDAMRNPIWIKNRIDNK